jgi:hypothetical protein
MRDAGETDVKEDGANQYSIRSQSLVLRRRYVKGRMGLPEN